MSEWINAYDEVGNILTEICEKEGGYYSDFIIKLNIDCSKENIYVSFEDFDWCFEYDFDEGNVIELLGAVRVEDIDIPNDINVSIRSREQRDEYFKNH